MADRQSEGIYASLQRSPHHPDLVKSPHELQDGLSLDSRPNFDEELGLTHSDLQFLHDSNPFDGLPDTILDHLDIFSDLWAGNERNDGSGHTDSLSQRNNTEGVSTEPFDINQNFPSSFPSSKDQLDDLLRDTLGLPSTSDRPEPCGSNENPETSNHKRSASQKSSINGVIDLADEPFRPAKRQCRDGPVAADDNRYMLPNTAGEVSRETPYTASGSLGSNGFPGVAFTGESDDLNSLFSEWDLDLKETPSNPTHQSSSGSHLIHSKFSVQPALSEKACDSYAKTSSQHSLALPKAAHQPTSIPIQSLSTACGDSQSYRHASVDSLFDDATIPDGPDVFQNHETLSPLTSDAQDQTLSQNSASTSSQILKKNGLQQEDLVSTRVRDVIRNTQAVSKYISPYPRVGGSLGYLPSNPTLHVKCVEVAEDEVVARLESYRKNVRTLAREKNKYMWANEDWKKANLGAGKSNEQVLKEELMCLRRALNAKDKKAKAALEEAAAWRNGYRNIAFVYSNLLHGFAPRSAINRPIATSNKPPIPQTPATLPSSQNGNHPNPDATVRQDNEKASAASAAKLPSIQPNVEALTAMQKRQYNWLPGQNPLQKNIRPRPHGGNQYGREGSQQTLSPTSNPSSNQNKSGESTHRDNSVIEVESEDETAQVLQAELEASG